MLFVIKFSKGKLSRAQDKLAAALGVTTQMEEAIVSPYIAGLWVKDLLEQLLWRVNTQAEKLQPCSNSKQKSPWSWAAVNQSVVKVIAFVIFRQNARFLVKVITVETQHPGLIIHQNDAWIRLRGRLFMTSLFKKDRPWQSSVEMITLKGAQFENMMVTVLPDHLPSTRHVTCLPVLASTRGRNFGLNDLFVVKVNKEGHCRTSGRFIVELSAKLAKSYQVNLLEFCINGKSSIK